MKPIRNLPLTLFLLGGCVAWLSPVDALAQELTDEQAAILVIEATAPTPAADLPSAGNFYSAQHLPGGDDAWPPLPGSLGLDAWLLGSNVFLLNDLAVDYAAAAPLRSGSLSARAGGMQLLSLDPGDPGEGDTNTYAGGGGGPLAVTPFDTNGLWLEITNYATVYSDYNLHHATNQGGLYGGVYAIWTTTNLTTTWNLELELFPTDTNRQPFGLANQGRPMLFVRAQDFTAVDSNSDGVPDWWSWYFYGDFSGNATSLDSQGHTLLYDYTNHLDPNVISFSLSVTNLYVNSMTAPVQVNVAAGVPGYYAVLVNDTNLAHASWQPYTTSSLNVYLGLSDGTYNVSVGLRGLPADATQTWQSQTLFKDTTAPWLTITNPAGGTVDQPMIQLEGYSPEPLASLFFDVSNAVAVVTNQQGFITDQFYDTNTWAFTTNYFQCFDIVVVTNGANLITLHATDRAGNTRTTNFIYTVSYAGKTNPPAFTLAWPLSGTKISGDQFTIVGRLADYTAGITATLTDTNGLTNIVDGVVERDGTFWVDYLPLAPGTNTVTVTATDPAGNVNTTNIVVYQSDVVLTINAPNPDELWNSTFYATGTINTNYTVWVNGVQVTNNGGGSWEGPVPVNLGGVADFNMTAYPPGHNPGGGGGGGSGGSGGGGCQNPADTNAVNFTLHVDKPVRVFVDSDVQKMDSSYHEMETRYGTDTNGPANFWSGYTDTVHYDHHWTDGLGGGGATGESYITMSSDTNYVSTNIWTLQMTWATNRWPWLADGSGLFTGDPTYTPYTNGVQSIGRPAIGMGTYAYHALGEHCDVSDPVPAQTNWGWSSYYGYYSDESDQTYVRHAQTQFKLHTGGRAVPGRKSLIKLSGGAFEVLDKRAVPYFYEADVRFIPPQTLTVGTLGNLNTNGDLYVILPDGDPDVTIVSNGLGFCVFSVSAVKYKMTLTATNNGAGIDISQVVPTYCVGEQIIFAPHFPSGLPDEVQLSAFAWKFAGTFVNDWTNANAHSSTDYFMNTSRLTNYMTTNWWVSGNSQVPAFYRVVFSNTLTFPDGKGGTVWADGFVRMFRPNVNWTATNTGSINIDMDYLPGGGSPPTNPTNAIERWLHFGGASDAVHGILFKTNNFNSGGFGGALSVVQLISSSALQGCKTNGQSLYYTGAGKDKPQLFDPLLKCWYDEPGWAAHVDEHRASDESHYQTFLMYQPGEPSIAVPIRRIEWYWSAVADKTSGVWTLTSSNGAITANNGDTLNFPTWTNVINDLTNYNLTTTNICR